MLAVYFVLLAAVGGPSDWNELGVPPMAPRFADMRSVTSAWECDRQGIEVIRSNPCDPYGGRPANYPRVWLLPSATGMGQEATIWLGTLTGLLFLAAALAVLPRAAGPGEAVAYGALLCSPAAMLGVERGNVDLLLFALLVFAIVLLQRTTVARVAGYAMILLASVLKLFPVFAALLLLRRGRREELLAGGAITLGFSAYAVVTLDDIRTIADVVPQQPKLSYGIARFASWITAELDGPWSVLDQSLRVATGRELALALSAAVVLTALAARRLGLVRVDDRPAGAEGRRERDLFWAGAAVYAFSYVLLLNWDYRLVFTLTTVPLLLRWLRDRRPLAVVTTTALFCVLWLDSHEYWLPVGEVPQLGAAVSVAQFVLFACYAAALVATARLPAWMAPPRRYSAAARTPSVP